MRRSQTRTLQRLALSLVAGIVFTTQFGMGYAQAAQTTPGTVISNTATATYNDTNGNTYSTNSNTVTTTVQNAPSLTVTPQAAQTVAPGQLVVDTYTLTNTGNAPGNFSLPAAGTVSANGTFAGYVIAGTTCTNAAPCTLANANTALAGLTPTAAGGTLAVGVEYTVSNTAVAGNTVTTTLNANITYPAATGSPQAVSATVTGTDTDTVAAQARLDLSKSVTPPATAGATIPFTIIANNGGGFAATDLQSVKALLGSPAAGVVVTDAIPTFNNVPLNLSGTPTATLANANTGATPTIYYSTSSTGAAGSWSTTYATGDFYIAVLVSGGTGGIELPSRPTGSAGAGSVSSPQITLNFATVQPTGSGSANANAISNLANSLIGGNPGATGVIPVIGPFPNSGEADGATPAFPITAAVTNQTPSTNAQAPGGASNKVTSAAFSASSVLVGPANNAGATGSYPAAPNNGGGAASNNNDFTAVGFACSNGTSINNGAFACQIPAAGVTVPGSYTNTGNAADTLTISATAPAGFTASIFNAVCPATITTLTAATCTKGAQIGATSAAGGTASGTIGIVGSGVSGSYEVVYLPAAANTTVAPFTAIDSVVTVAGSAAGVAADTNTTHIDLYPGGPISLAKSQSVVTNCPAGSTGQAAANACPGGVITYTVTYTNNAPAGAVVTNVGTEPAFAYNGIVASSGTFVITEDGTGANVNTAGNNWATFTGGLDAAPTSTGPVAFNYVYAPTPGVAAGSTKFTATATSTVAPGATGTVVFSVTVK